VKRPVPSAHQLGKLFALLFWICLMILCFIFRDRLTVEGIVNFVPPNPVVAAGVMLLLFCIKGVSVFIYCGLLYAVSGVLFPLLAALTVNILGSALMISLPFWIGRKAGADALERLIARNPKLHLLKEIPNQNGVAVTFFVRIVGILPSDPVSMYFGASGIRYTSFLVGSVSGLLPMIVSFTVMGMSVQDMTSPAFIISVCVELGLMILSVALYCTWRRYCRKKKQE